LIDGLQQANSSKQARIIIGFNYRNMSLITIAFYILKAKYWAYSWLYEFFWHCIYDLICCFPALTM